jgi:hypothetical protein
LLLHMPPLFLGLRDLRVHGEMVEIRVFRFWVVMLNLKGFVVGLNTLVRTTKGWI